MDDDITMQQVIEGPNITRIPGGQPAGNDGRVPIHASLSPQSGDGSHGRPVDSARPRGMSPRSAMARTQTCVTAPLDGCADPPHPRAAQPAPPIATPRSTLIP